MRIYYAHSRHIYGTYVENAERTLISRRYPGCEIVNPADMFHGPDAQRIWDEWLRTGGLSSMDILVFTDYNGYVGKGVYTEITYARGLDIPVVYMTHTGRFTKRFILGAPDERDWIRYSKVMIDQD